jgi:L-rhamnose isomerase
MKLAKLEKKFEKREQKFEKREQKFAKFKDETERRLTQLEIWAISRNCWRVVK